MARTAADRIVAFLEAARAGVPDEASHAAKRLLVNGLRAALVSRTDPLSTPVTAAVAGARAAGAAGVHTIWSDAVTGVEEASFANAFNWSLVLLDDLELVSGTHPTGPAAGAALALAEQRRSSGPELLRAIVAGIELQVAVAQAAAPELLNERGFAPLTVVAPLGAAAAAVVLAGAPPEVAAHAIGIAAMSGVGMWEQGGTASSLWLSGSATRSGVAALAGALAGVDAPPRALDGDFGAFHAYCGKDADVLAARLAGLGEQWVTPQVAMQPFSGDTYSQAPLECVRELRRQLGRGALAGAPTGAGAGRPAAPGRRGEASAGELSEIVVRANERTARGIERKHSRYPRITTALQLNSDPQSRVAAAWLRGVYSYGAGFEALVEDEEVRALRERVRFVHDPEQHDMSLAAVEAHLADGTTMVASTSGFRGSPFNPLSDDELSDWFRAAADGLLAPSRAEAVLDATWGLDDASGGGPAALVELLGSEPEGLR